MTQLCTSCLCKPLLEDYAVRGVVTYMEAEGRPALQVPASAPERPQPLQHWNSLAAHL